MKKVYEGSKGYIALTQDELNAIKEENFKKGYEKAKAENSAKKDEKKANKSKVKTDEGKIEDLRKNVVVDGE